MAKTTKKNTVRVEPEGEVHIRQLLIILLYHLRIKLDRWHGHQLAK